MVNPMTRASIISTVVILASLAVSGIAFHSWLEAHDDRVQMQATVNAQKQLIAAAEQREQQRAVELKDTLAQIAELKRQVLSPQQIVRELPRYLPLPQPIQLVPPVQQGSGEGSWKGNSLPEAAKPHQALSGANLPALSEATMPGSSQANVPTPSETNVPAVQFPVEDLKPLYDFVQDCRACKAQLDVARADLNDERTKSAALTKERDAALKAAKGSSFWARLGSNVKWLALGTGVGVILARASH